MEIVRMEVASCSLVRLATTRIRTLLANNTADKATTDLALNIPHQAFVSSIAIEVGDRRYSANVGAKTKVIDPNVTCIETRHLKSPNLTLESELWSALHVVLSVESSVQLSVVVEYQQILHRSVGVYTLALYAPFQQDIPLVQYNITVIEQTALATCALVQYDLTTQLRMQKREEVVDGWKVNYVSLAADQAVQKSFNAGKTADAPSTITLLFDPVTKDPISDIIVLDHSYSYWLQLDSLPVMDKNIIFVIDRTSSMQSSNRWTHTLNALKTIINRLTYKDIFNVVTFADTSTKWEHNSVKATISNKAKAIQFIEKTRPNGNTNLGDALRMGYEQLVKDVGRMKESSGCIFSLFIVLDGVATVGETRTDALEHLIAATRRPCLRVFGAAIGGDADYILLRRLAARTNALATRVTDGANQAKHLVAFYMNNVHRPVLVLDSLAQVTYTHHTPYTNFPMVVDQSFQSDRMPMVVGSSRLIVGHAAEEKAILPTKDFKLSMRVEAEREGYNQDGKTDLSKQPAGSVETLDIPGPNTMADLTDRLCTHLAISRQMDIARFRKMDLARQRELIKICSILSRKHRLLTTTTAYLLQVPAGSGVQITDAYMQLAGESCISSMHKDTKQKPANVSPSEEADTISTGATISATSIEPSTQISTASLEMMSSEEMKKKGGSDVEVVDPQALQFWLNKQSTNIEHTEEKEEDEKPLYLPRITAMLILAIILYWIFSRDQD